MSPSARPTSTAATGPARTRARRSCSTSRSPPRTSSGSSPIPATPPGPRAGSTPTPSAAGWPVSGGRVQPVRRPPARRREKRMLYHLQFSDGEGHPLTMTGFKVVQPRPRPRRLVGDHDALHPRAGRSPGSRRRTTGGEVVASGIIHIHPLDFARQMTTFRTEPPGRVDALARFGDLFAGELWSVYGPGPGGRRERAGRAVHGRRRPGAEPHQRPGAASRRRRAPCCSSTAPACGPTSSAPRAGATSSMCSSSEGWDVWLENWRASIDIPHNHWTLDQAAVYDHPRAVQTVCTQTGASEIKAVIHCQGSTSFMMSALAGLVPQVTTIVSNAVSVHPDGPAVLAELKLRVDDPLRRPGCSATWTRSGGGRARRGCCRSWSTLVADARPP